ncbi:MULTISPECIES: ATP-binding protein [Streptomyces]|uniref:ATP-binding protein n=1 Tax=Streptomyces TaxID=1883 RepID=UPI00167601D6|nr:MULTISPECIES: ATP-binding protein [Streptomyces]MBD3577694.1 ATP-binding protein [Streptomyces sp. KD18]
MTAGTTVVRPPPQTPPARLLAVAQLHAREASPGVTERAERIIAELTADAVLHGRVQGRGFRVALALDTGCGSPGIAVTDCRGGRVPAPGPGAARPEEAESGRGLLLVAAFADRWGTEPYPPGGKTVRAELDLAPTRTCMAAGVGSGAAGEAGEHRRQADRAGRGVGGVDGDGVARASVDSSGKRRTGDVNPS